MASEIKKRINTGLSLFLILILMFISKIFYLFISFVIFSLAFIEFTKITKKIFFRYPIKQLIANLFFIFYLFSFLLIFIVSINDIHLKIILFLLLIICAFSDIGGIIFGKFFKGPKLTQISPNKTISGSLGSIIFSVVTSIILMNLIFDTHIYYNIFLGFVISISVQIGDLFFSYLKRKSNIKNTGNILPGHGGILDRIDGILLGLPVGLILLLIQIYTI